MLSKKWCSRLLDGALTDHGAYISGRYRGFNTVIYEINNRSTQIVRIAASSDSDNNGYGLNTFLNSLIPLNKTLKAATADGHTVTLTFVIATPKKFVEIANDVIGRVVLYLMQNGYTTGCGSCGSPYSVELYRINSHYLWLCPGCAGEYTRELEQHKEKSKAQRSNLAPGIVGAFLGALIGAVLYVLVYQLGYVAGICGFVMAVMAMRFYEKFGGCLDLKGVIASIVVLIIMVYFSNKVSWAFSAYEALKDRGWTFFECFRELDMIILKSDLKSSYNADIWTSYFISILGCIGSFVKAIRGSSGSYVFKKLES